MKYFIKKIITLIITLLFISLLTFTAFSVIPGDAAVSKLGVDASPEAIARVRAEYELDQPVLTRYVHWLGKALHGDFGQSYKYDTMTVTQLLQSRLPVTILLAVMSFIIIVVVSLPLGMLSARYAGKWLDILINQITQITMAIPSFFLGIILTVIFGLVLKVFQLGGYVSMEEDLKGCIEYLILPAVAVALPKIAMVVKYLRNSVLSEMKKDYVRTAYSKGNSVNQVLYGHVLRNALIPVITFVAMVAAEILAGSLVIEQVFSIPGMGRLMITSISTRDYPVVQAAVLYITSIVVIINFLVDVLYQLGAMGITPLIAHVERYPYVMENPSLLVDWIEAGAYTHVNASSLVLHKRRKVQILKMIRHGLVHFVCTDAHSPDKRPPLLGEAMELIQSRCGEQKARQMGEIALGLWSGEQPDQPEPVPMRRLFGRWF